MRMQEGRLRESEVEKRRGGRTGESLWDCRSACSAHMIILPRAARDLSAFREGSREGSWKNARRRNISPPRRAAEDAPVTAQHDVPRWARGR